MVDAHIQDTDTFCQTSGTSNEVFFDLAKRDALSPNNDGSPGANGFWYKPWPNLPLGHILPQTASDALRENAPDLYQRRLLLAAELAAYIRQQVSDKVGLTCSAGIAHGKILAKLVGSMHKPHQQTAFAPSCLTGSESQEQIATSASDDDMSLAKVRGDQVRQLFDNLDLRKLSGFGSVAVSKISEALFQDMERQSGVSESVPRLTVAQARKAGSLSMFEGLFGARIGRRLWLLLHGIDDEDVVTTPDFPVQISIEDTYPHPGIRGQEIHRQILVLSTSLLRRLEFELIEHHQDALLENVKHEPVISSQELKTYGADSSATDQVLVRSYREVQDLPRRGPSCTEQSRTKSYGVVGGTQRVWMRYPGKIRLSVRQGWANRVSKQAPIPVEIFDSALEREERSRILAKACRALLRALIGGDDVVGDSINLINIAALELNERRPTRAIDSFFSRERSSTVSATSSGAQKTAAAIDLGFLAALPEDLRQEIAAENGLDPGLLYAVRSQVFTTDPTDSDGFDEHPDPNASSKSVASHPLAVQDEDGALKCAHCGARMLVWMQHDHDIWPLTGLPPKDPNELDCAINPHDGSESDGLEGQHSEMRDVKSELFMGSDGDRQKATGSPPIEEEGGYLCDKCGSRVQAWMRLAHERFHELTGDVKST